jgi:Domain of unknown function (DUF4382)
MKKNIVKISFYIVVVTILFFLATLSSCNKTSSNTDTAADNVSKAKVTVMLTDHQSLIFDKVFLDIIKLEIKVEDNGIDSLGGWYNLNITPGVFDILKFKNGFDTLFANGTIPLNRKLQKIRMTLGNANTVVYQGNTYPLEVKDNNNEVIAKLDDSNVDFTAPNQFMFWIDFDAHHSIEQKSNNKFELKSKIRIFTKSKSGRIEGRVLPPAAKAMVLAIKGTDTAVAIPENDGEFKIVGLPAGTYKVYIDATANNYKDSIVNNVIVQHNDDTKLNTVLLHQ